MNKKTSIFGMIFAVAFVAMVASWLNHVNVNATTVADFIKSKTMSQSEVVQEPITSASDALIVIESDFPMMLSSVPLGMSEPATSDMSEYIAELEATRAELRAAQETLAEIKVEIELLKSTPHVSPEADETESGDDTDIEEDVVLAESEFEEIGEAADHVETIPQTNVSAPMTDAEIWNAQFLEYQKWAQQYVTE